MSDDAPYSDDEPCAPSTPEASASDVAPEARPGPPPSHFKRRLKAFVAMILLCIAGLGGSAFMVYGYGSSSYRWRGLDLQIRLIPSMHGETRLVFTPLGEVRAHTHRTPLTLSIAVQEVSFEELKRFLQKPPERAALEQEFQEKARHVLIDFSCRQVALGMAGALLVPLLLRLKKARFYTLPALTGGAFVAYIFFHTAGSFNPRAFANPTYTGSLQQANWIIALVKDGFMKADVLSVRLKQVADNLNTLYGRIQSIPGVSNRETIKVLHISDMHNNPAATGFVRELADKMGVDMVIDTGDLTDFGLPIETELARTMGQLKVPYLFVAGNHDSQATVKALALNRNAIFLHDEPVKVAGLSVIGSSDPSSARSGQGDYITPDDTLKAASDLLLQAYLKAPADIVCVHNPKQAAAVIGKAKLVLCGHVHRASLETTQGTVVCNAGTTGGAGVSYFENKEGEPLTAAILFFSRTPDHRLLYVDRVTLAGNLGEYSLTRKSFEPVPPLGGGGVGE